MLHCVGDAAVIISLIGLQKPATCECIRQGCETQDKINPNRTDRTTEVRAEVR